MENEIDFLQELSNFTFTQKYARYKEEASRRETWPECGNRTKDMHIKRFKKVLDKDHLTDLRHAFTLVRAMKIVPAMRSLQFAGPAVEAHNARIYNCAVRHVDSPRAFAEVFYMLLCGNGVGLGLSKFFLDRMPHLVSADDKTGTVITYTIEDSIEGWADSIESLLNCYLKNTAYTGRKIVFDYSRVRKKGAELKTAGGKAPGYKGLKECHKKVKALLDHIIEDLNQQKLHPINAYDIIMHCADAVLSGGIRRSATSVIFDPDDEEMLNAKTFFTVSRHTKFVQDDDTQLWHGKVTIGKKKYEVEIKDFEWEQLQKDKTISWLHIEPQRARSNNSVLLLRDKVTLQQFKDTIQRTRQFGEPGFVFGNHPWQLFNPCFEIGFIPVTDDGVCGAQFCNLTSMNGALIKTKEDYFECVKYATIIGTCQAAYTDFKYLGHASKEITEDESLLGVSMTGIMDNPEVLLNPEFQREAAKIAVDTNKEWAKILGIKPAARITCVKPEGTSSLVLKSASGIHAHHSRRYFRRCQVNKLDPVYKYFKKHNPHMCEESVWSANKTDDVVKFPLSIPETSWIKPDLSAEKHLGYIKSTQQNWVIPGTTPANKKPVEHNVSCTVIVDEDEWDKVAEHLYDNREYFAAVSLLPKSGDKMYAQAPNEAITEDDEAEWDRIVTGYKPVDYTQFKEKEDKTSIQASVACAGGACELSF